MLKKLFVVAFSFFMLLVGGTARKQRSEVKSLPGIEISQVDGAGGSDTCKIYRQVKDS